MSNGHSSDVDENHLKPSPQPPRSESELSDINDIPDTTMSSVTGQDDADHSEDDAIHDMATSELDDDEDAPGEEDADFDEETPPPEAADGMRHDRSTSEDSLRPGKRKVDGLDDEEYMKQNPELYGLRRSVRSIYPPQPFTVLTCWAQGRARPSRRVVRAPSFNTCVEFAKRFLQVDSSDDEDDEDDVNTGRRRKRQKTNNGRPGTYLHLPPSLA